jgi:hypothetical protein
MKRNKRLPIPQKEFGFTTETFNLIQEWTLGERVARELEKAKHEHRQAEAAQFQFPSHDSEEMFVQAQLFRFHTPQPSNGRGFLLQIPDPLGMRSDNRFVEFHPKVTILVSTDIGTPRHSRRILTKW